MATEAIRRPPSLGPAALTMSLALVILGWAGCSGNGDAPRRYHLSGRATFEGRPIPFGQIIFDPDASAGNSGPQGMATIRDGRYAVEDGKGPIGGPHRISIVGFEGQQLDEHGPAPKRLFPEYQTTVDLPKQNDTYDFEVPAAGTKALGPDL